MRYTTKKSPSCIEISPLARHPKIILFQLILNFFTIFREDMPKSEIRVSDGYYPFSHPLFFIHPVQKELEIQLEYIYDK